MTETSGAPKPTAGNPAPTKKRGGLWKGCACGCAVLLVLAMAAAVVAGFLAYKGILFAKKKGTQAVRLLEQKPGVPAGAVFLDGAKMAALFEASDRWPAIQEAMDAGNRAALDEEARRLGLEDGRKLERYMAVVILAGTMTFVPEGTRREMLAQSVGPQAAEVVMAPQNQEKVRRFLKR